MARSRCKIISDILETVKKEENCKKTKIIRLANLDWDMASRYLNLLVQDDFLECSDDESKGNCNYELTENGELFLESLQKTREVCSLL